MIHENIYGCVCLCKSTGVVVVGRMVCSDNLPDPSYPIRVEHYPFKYLSVSWTTDHRVNRSAHVDAQWHFSWFYVLQLEFL